MDVVTVGAETANQYEDSDDQGESWNDLSGTWTDVGDSTDDDISDAHWHDQTENSSGDDKSAENLPFDIANTTVQTLCQYHPGAFTFSNYFGTGRRSWTCW